jgi:hypothetical protein
LNSNDGFSVGVPEYLLTIDNTDINIVLSNYSHDEEAWAINEDGPLSPSNPVIMVDENRYYVYGDDSVDGINDANRNYATYVASMQSMAGGSTDSGGACSVVTKDNLEVRVGFEIETCFANKPKSVSGSTVGSCRFTNDKLLSDQSGIEFLDTTLADDSLFKGVPEDVSNCKSDNDCNVELIINNNKHVLFDGNNFNVDESEFKTSIQDLLDNNITSCGTPRGGEPSDANSDRYSLLSTCGVHLHISVPSLKTNKDLFKILVFYLWFTKYQNMLKSENPNYVTVGWYDAPYVLLSEIDFPFPDASQITTMVSDPDSNKDMIQTFVNTLPGQNFSPSLTEDRGTEESNVIIVDKRYGNPFPHFEFRGHYDLMKSISSSDPTADLVYEHLKNYTHSIWEVLNEAHNML